MIYRGLFYQLARAASRAAQRALHILNEAPASVSLPTHSKIQRGGGPPPPAVAVPRASVCYANGIMTAPSGRIISGVQLPLPNAPSIMAM